MCWAHVRRNVVKQLHLVDEMYREDVMVDIDKLQLASNKEVFNIAKDLFINGTLKNKLHSLII
jgi:exosome complex RNA-binding protein Rrp42 (RNase PH superfamily)